SLGFEAYVYLYPLVIMEVSGREALNDAKGERAAFAPPHAVHHPGRIPSAAIRAVVARTFLTLRCSAWVDLTRGPVVVHARDTEDRYFMLPMLDMWTDVFLNPGKRTTGTGAQDFVVAGPGYTGELPNGVPVVAAPTPWVWVIGRTQTNGPADYAA